MLNIFAVIGSFLAAFSNTPSEDITCLAKNIYFEARNQPIEGQFAVAEVTLNRVNMLEYPSTICAVVKQEDQFSWYSDGKSDIPREKDAWERAQTIAYAYVVNPTDYTKGATHYHANYVAPKWKNKLTKTARIGAHEFYKI